MEKEEQYLSRSNWLRAAVLGANDGILSTASIAVGIAAASNNRTTVVIGAVAGLIAGALSMAAGEYVSVSSQADIEAAELERKNKLLAQNPNKELEKLVDTYEERGLETALAKEVAIQLTDHNALEAHARDRLGINTINTAQPIQAAWASGLAFTTGGMLPVTVAVSAPMSFMIHSQYIFAILFLILLGALSAKTGGSSLRKAITRISFWGTFAMGLTALVGSLFGNYG